MKHSFVSLVTILLLVLCSQLLIQIYEVKAFKTQNTTLQYLKAQAQLHLIFLEHKSKTLNLKQIKSLELKDNGFKLKVLNNQDTMDLFVSNVDFNISLHKTILK